MNKLLIFSTILLVLLSGCDDKKELSKAPGMKCGAGKCGANMFDGNSALIKKKKNILSQMRDDDTRKNCVIGAKTTKEVYNCVRDKNSGKLTMKCGAEEMQKNPTMKCGAGKCGGSM